MAVRPVLPTIRPQALSCPFQCCASSSRSSLFGRQSSKPIRSFVSSPPALSVSDEEIAHLARQSIRPLTLSDLVKHGRPPLSPSSLLASARFTLSHLPTRLAHRLHAIRNLPFIVVSNPHISSIYSNYLHSLKTLLPFYHAGIHTQQDEEAFTDVLADLVQTHASTIPTLAKGLKECGRYLGMGFSAAGGEGGRASSTTSNGPRTGSGGRFLDEHLRARIGTRLLAEQHIALHLASQPDSVSGGHASLTAPPPPQQQQQSSFVGVIDTALSPVAVLRQCEAFVGELCELKYGVRPTVAVCGDVDARIAHVPTHVEYILTELLKNAFRATVERAREREPVEATIAVVHHKCHDDDDDDDHHHHHEKTAGDARTSLTLRIRDRGGGIAPDVLPRIWDYSFTTFDDCAEELDGLAALGGAAGAEGSSIAGLGYGLPLGRAYAEHFGGELNVESLWGWGTDVYLRLKGLETGVL